MEGYITIHGDLSKDKLLRLEVLVTHNKYNFLHSAFFHLNQNGSHVVDFTDEKKCPYKQDAEADSMRRLLTGDHPWPTPRLEFNDARVLVLVNKWLLARQPQQPPIFTAVRQAYPRIQLRGPPKLKDDELKVIDKRLAEESPHHLPCPKAARLHATFMYEASPVDSVSWRLWRFFLLDKIF